MDGAGNLEIYIYDEDGFFPSFLIMQHWRIRGFQSDEDMLMQVSLHEAEAKERRINVILAKWSIRN